MTQTMEGDYLKYSSYSFTNKEELVGEGKIGSFSGPRIFPFDQTHRV